MISLFIFIHCVDIDEVVFEINGNEFYGKEIHQYYYLSEIKTMKISKIYVNSKNMITAVVHFD